MGIYGRKKRLIEEDSNNIFWTTMSDLLLGLAIIFMTLFILAMSGFTQENVKIQQQQLAASKELAQNFKQNQIDVDVDQLTGNVKISDIQLLEVGSYTLSDKGKKFLDKFVPIYINTIFNNPVIADNIENIIIQGHTDSQMFKDAKTPNEQFSKNMFLSLQRAYAVQDYMLKTKYNKNYDPKLRKLVIVEGRSFSEPVLNDSGKEDLDKSRRVELKLRVKGKNLSEVFGFNFGAN